MEQSQLVRNFAVNLKRILEAKKMSQNELHLLTGLTQATISYYISGSKSPQLDSIGKIAEALNLPTSELLKDPNEPITTKSHPEVSYKRFAQLSDTFSTARDPSAQEALHTIQGKLLELQRIPKEVRQRLKLMNQKDWQLLIEYIDQIISRK